MILCNHGGHRDTEEFIVRNGSSDMLTLLRNHWLSATTTHSLRISALVVPLFLFVVARSVTAGTLTVRPDVSAGNPDILAYNVGHFAANSNTHDWWRYAGVNGARIFISPGTVERETP